MQSWKLELENILSTYEHHENYIANENGILMVYCNWNQKKMYTYRNNIMCM